jgi:hypothetical protein
VDYLEISDVVIDQSRQSSSKSLSVANASIAVVVPNLMWAERLSYLSMMDLPPVRQCVLRSLLFDS